MYTYIIYSNTNIFTVSDMAAARTLTKRQCPAKVRVIDSNKESHDFTAAGFLMWSEA